MPGLILILMVVAVFVGVFVMLIPSKKWRALIGGILMSLIWLGFVALYLVGIMIANGLSDGPSHGPGGVTLVLVPMGGLGLIWLIAWGVWRSWWAAGWRLMARGVRRLGREIHDEIHQLFS